VHFGLGYPHIVRMQRSSRVLAMLAAAGAGAVATHDLTQRHRALLRNRPVLGHARYLIEKMGPELRQYIVAAGTHIVNDGLMG
jgi:hypothetical protein